MLNMTYSCEAWTIIKKKRKITTAELRFYCRLQRVQWIENRTNRGISLKNLQSIHIYCEIKMKKAKIYRPCIEKHKFSDDNCTPGQGRGKQKSRMTIHHMHIASITESCGVSVISGKQKQRPSNIEGNFGMIWGSNHHGDANR